MENEAKQGADNADWVSYEDGRKLFESVELSDKDFSEQVWVKGSIRNRGKGSTVEVRLSDVMRVRDELGPRKSRRE